MARSHTLELGEDRVDVAYTVGAVEWFEQHAKKGIVSALQDWGVASSKLMLLAGARACDPVLARMDEDDQAAWAENKVQRYFDSGGSLSKLLSKLIVALREFGVLNRPDADQKDRPSGATT